MVDLSQKLRNFTMNLSGIKRKAVCVLLTQCQHCGRIWLDKIYKDKLPHKIICAYCHLQQVDNFGEPVECNDMNYESWLEWGLSRDIAADGVFGARESPGRKSKIMDRERFESIYGRQVT